MQDEYYMRLALQLAELGKYQTTPNPLVGAVLVRDDEIVGQGAHLKAGEPHAERYALRMAGEKAAGATLYVTLEPCSHHGRTPPCADAIIESGVKRVVVAVQDANPVVKGQGIKRLQSAGIEVRTGVMEQEARIMNEQFFTWIGYGRPFVVWKCAATLDGYIAAKSGDSKYVTGDDARQTVQELRRELPAIAVGIGTVVADDPRLTVRAERSKQPLRVVFDSHLRFPVSARMLQEPGKTLIYTTQQADTEARHDLDEFTGKVDVIPVSATEEGRVCIRSALRDLAARYVTGLLLEGGSTLVSEFIQERLIDKVVYYVAPKLLGGGIPALQGIDPPAMSEAISLRDFTWSNVGPDLRLEAYPEWR